jgi:hypothetical protein
MMARNPCAVALYLYRSTQISSWRQITVSIIICDDRYKIDVQPVSLLLAGGRCQGGMYGGKRSPALF